MATTYNGERVERPYRCHGCGRIVLSRYTPKSWYSLVRFDPTVDGRTIRAGLFCDASCLLSYGDDLIELDRAFDAARNGEAR